MEAWNALAVTISGVSGFDRPNLDGKKVQNRFSLLLEKHEDDDKVSARASRVSEEYTKKRQLLDDFSAMVNDHNQDEEAKSEEERKKKEAEVAAGALAREKAMEALGKRAGNSDQSTPQKEGRLNRPDSNAYRDQRMFHNQSHSCLESRVPFPGRHSMGTTACSTSASSLAVIFAQFFSFLL